MAKNRNNRNPGSTTNTAPQENTMAEDTTQGGTGDDTVEDTTQDSVPAETTQDTTTDTVTGAAGTDTVAGATGEDTVAAATGTDTVVASTGTDTVTGGDAPADTTTAPTETAPTSDAAPAADTVQGATATPDVISTTSRTGTITLTEADIAPAATDTSAVATPAAEVVVTSTAPVIDEAPLATAAPAVTANTIDLSTGPSVLANAVNPSTPQVDEHSILVRLAFNDLDEYTVKMHHRKPISDKEGAQHQVRLFNLLKSLINNAEDEEFHKAFTKLLAWFHEHRDGITHDHHMYRFAGEMQLTPTDRDAFYSLLDLLKLASDPVGRVHQLKQYSFRLGMERVRAKGRGITEQGVQRIMTYFDVQ